MPVHHLYLHVPFCHRICPYCGFFKHTPGGTDIGTFVAAVLAELDSLRVRYPLDLRTLYFGGGTPTMLSPTHLGALLTGLARRLDLGKVEEWTVEANPRTFDHAKVRLLVEAGVTRTSLGVQSWNQRHLATLGRDHSPDEAREAYTTLREAGMPSVNIDHMFALPGQSLAEWEADLQATTALGPDHVSTYNLTYEEDTAFLDRFRAVGFVPDPDAEADFFELAHGFLAAAGFDHYETSNYARPGHRSLHNNAYWRGEDYLGLGPGAVSTVGRRRWTNVPDTALYIASVTRDGHPAAREEGLSDEAWRTERIALGLRTAEGLPLEWLDDEGRARLAVLAADGLLDATSTHVRLRPRGHLVADAIAVELV